MPCIWRTTGRLGRAEPPHRKTQLIGHGHGIVVAQLLGRPAAQAVGRDDIGGIEHPLVGPKKSAVRNDPHHASGQSGPSRPALPRDGQSGHARQHQPRQIQVQQPPIPDNASANCRGGAMDKKEQQGRAHYFLPGRAGHDFSQRGPTPMPAGLPCCQRQERQQQYAQAVLDLPQVAEQERVALGGVALQNMARQIVAHGPIRRRVAQPAQALGRQQRQTEAAAQGQQLPPKAKRPGKRPPPVEQRSQQQRRPGIVTGIKQQQRPRPQPQPKPEPTRPRRNRLPQYPKHQGQQEQQGAIIRHHVAHVEAGVGQASVQNGGN